MHLCLSHILNDNNSVLLFVKCFLTPSANSLLHDRLHFSVMEILSFEDWWKDFCTDLSPDSIQNQLIFMPGLSCQCLFH